MSHAGHGSCVEKMWISETTEWVWGFTARDASFTLSNIMRNLVQTKMYGMTCKARILRDHHGKDEDISLNYAVTERDNIGTAIECI